MNLTSGFKKRITSLMLVFLLFCTSLLEGCTRPPENPSPTTAVPFSEETAQSYEHFEESQLKAQKEFDELMETIFLDEVSHGLLDLHFKLKDPSAYGISGA